MIQTKENNIIVAYGNKMITLQPDSTQFNLIKQILKLNQVKQETKEPRYALRLGLMHVTASSIYDANHNSYKLDNSEGTTALCTQTKNCGQQYIQAYSNISHKIIGIVIQGRKAYKQWIKKYQLFYSTNNYDFLPLFDSRQFNGNCDNETKVYHYFQTPIVAKAIRILPTECNDHISLRFDVLIE